jgi:hypothetical protein
MGREGCNCGEENSLPHLARIPPGRVLLRIVDKKQTLTAVKDGESSKHIAQVKFLGFHPRAALP